MWAIAVAGDFRRTKCGCDGNVRGLPRGTTSQTENARWLNSRPRISPCVDRRSSDNFSCSATSHSFEQHSEARRPRPPLGSAGR